MHFCQLLLYKFFRSMHSFFEKRRQRRKNILCRGVICCPGGLCAVQEGYMDAQEGRVLFRGGHMLRCSEIQIFQHLNKVSPDYCA